MRSARRANAAVGLNGMLMALVIGVSCVRSQRTLQPTPEPSLQTCRSGTGTSFTVDEPNADTPILVLHTPYAGFSQVSPLPTFVVWRNGDVLFTVKDGAGDFRTQMGHLDPETAIALVADVVQQLDGEPAFQEPRPSITDQPMNRLFAFSDDAWRSWSVYGWWSDELVNSATLEAEYREFLNQERALEERCETIGAMNLNSSSEVCRRISATHHNAAQAPGQLCASAFYRVIFRRMANSPGVSALARCFGGSTSNVAGPLLVGS